MKLRNKLTGEINILKVDEDYFNIYKDDGEFVCPVTLKELNDGWEDYEEPKKHYEILAMGAVMECKDTEDEIFRNQGQREIGNYFETQEEAEKAVEKLKAIKRLKDYNVKFNLDFVKNKIDFTYSINNTLLDVLDEEEQIFNNMKIVFGGEES